MEDGDLAHEDGDRMMLGKRWWMVGGGGREKGRRREEAEYCPEQSADQVAPVPP
jgi:hypothetical protein